MKTIYRAAKTAVCIAASTLLLFLPFMAGTALAQDQQPVEQTDFSLFEETNMPTVPTINRDMERTNQSSDRPAFTLVGTSRIGSKYSAILQYQDGRIVKMDVKPRANTNIPGYNRYTVVDIDAGQVSIQLPESEDCVEFNSLGVDCSLAGNIAMLSLANAEPIVPVVESPADPVLDPNGELVTDEQEPRSVNPFAAFREASEANVDTDTPNRFQARRIADEDVPPGMRRVRTPFGDRLVEQ